MRYKKFFLFYAGLWSQKIQGYPARNDQILRFLLHFWPKKCSVMLGFELVTALQTEPHDLVSGNFFTIAGVCLLSIYRKE